MSDLSWLNPTPHAIAVYASQPLSPAATQHSLPSGRYSLLGPDFHRLDRASFAWRTHSITSSARARSDDGTSKPSVLAVLRLITSSYLLSGHWPFSGLRPRAGICVFACRRTAVDPAATRRLRTGCDATQQSGRPGRSACLSLHVPLPMLPQPRLPRRILRRLEKEAEAPLRSPTTGIAGCCARTASGHTA